MVRGFAEAGGAWLAGLSRRRPEIGPETDAALPPAPPGIDGSNRPPPPFGSTGPHGHRQRMRERVLGAGPASLADYELLEMLLFLGIPRRDTKPLAKALINCFGSLAGVLSAAPEALSREGGLSDECAALLRLPELAAARLSGAEARDRPVLNNWEKLLAYFEAALTGAIAGQLRILFLDNRNRLLADEVVDDASTLDCGIPVGGGQDGKMAPDPSRQTMRRALDLHATALILVRVVPPGPVAKATLAREAALGARLARSAAPLAIIVHDHMLVGGDNWVSLKQKGLI